MTSTCKDSESPRQFIHNSAALRYCLLLNQDSQQTRKLLFLAGVLHGHWEEHIKHSITGNGPPSPDLPLGTGVGCGGSVGHCDMARTQHWPSPSQSRLCSPMPDTFPVSCCELIGSSPSLHRNQCQLPKKSWFCWRLCCHSGEKQGGSWDLFSSDLLPGPGSDQPRQPFIIFQEIFISFYEVLQVFTKTLWRPTKLKINMP